MKLKKTLLVSSFALVLLVGSSGLAISEHLVSNVERKDSYASIAPEFDEQTAESGTDADHPFLISNEGEFMLFSDKINNHAKEALNTSTDVTWGTAFYKLTADIDMSLIKNFAPLLSEDVIYHYKDYRMTIDGDNHAIKNLRFKNSLRNAVDDSPQAGSGLFTCFSGTLKNLSLEYSEYSVSYLGKLENFAAAIGGVAGVTAFAELDNVHVTFNCDYSIIGQYSDGINNSYYYVGGLVGFCGNYSAIKNCSVDAIKHTLKVNSNALQGYCGILCGGMKEAVMYNCYGAFDSATMTSSNTKGNAILGLTNGLLYNATVRNVYAYAGSKKFSAHYGACSYVGLVFGDRNYADHIYVYDKTGKDASGNNIEPYLLYSVVKTTMDSSAPVTLATSFVVGSETISASYESTMALEGKVNCLIQPSFAKPTTFVAGAKYYTCTGKDVAENRNYFLEHLSFANLAEAQTAGYYYRGYTYTEVTTPVADDLATYYVPTNNTIIRIESYTIPFDYAGTGDKKNLTDALNMFVTEFEYELGVNVWFESSALNGGLPFMQARYEGRTFLITYNGYDPVNGDYKINESHLPFEFTYGPEVTLPTNVLKDGFKFEGWYTTPDLQGSKIFKIEKNYFGDVILYPKFVKDTEESTRSVWIITGCVALVMVGAIVILAINLKKYKSKYHKQKRDTDNTTYY